MFWKFKRRFRIGMLRSGFYYCCVVICLILVMNLLALKLNFETIEGENYIDAGGTTLPSERKLQNIDVHYPFFNDLNPNMFVSRQGLRHTYENRLRKLLEIMETNLDNSAAKIVTEKTLPYEAYFPERLLYCDDVMNITDMTYMASGWTKAVFKGTFKGRQVAVKTVDVNGQDVTTCRDAGRSETDCYVKAAKKIVKEIVVLQALANDNVLKVLGFCLPRDADDNLYVAMVTELGESVDLIKLLQMSWEDRLRICLDITKIVAMMSETPYGSMSMNDFRRQQFVLVDGVLKLSDVDDSGFDDSHCASPRDCDVKFSSTNFSQRSRCIRGRCIEYNEKKNIYNAGRHFVTFLLPHGAPHTLRPIISEILDGYKNLTMTSKRLLVVMKRLTRLYESGWYLNRTSPAKYTSSYKMVDNTDMPGFHDYRCRMSVSMATCTWSAYDVREAEDVCSADDECKAFVVAPYKTWTGRTVVHFKNGVGSLAHNPNTTLYVKPGLGHHQRSPRFAYNPNTTRVPYPG